MSTEIQKRRAQRQEENRQRRLEGQRQLNEETQVIADFITVDEQTALVAWAHSIKAQLPVKNRLKSEGATGERRAEFLDKLPDGPAVVNELMDRARLALNLDADMIESPYKPRIVIHDAGADTRRHVDPHGGINAKHHMEKYGEDNEWRCDRHFKVNMLVQAPLSGGEFLLAEEPRIVPERAVIGFWGHIPHAVAKIEAGERILLTFGFCKNID
jgi:hypothetical protein